MARLGRDSRHVLEHLEGKKMMPEKYGQLPTEVWISIFRFVDEKDRCRLCRINKHWQAVLYNASELWRRLDLSNRYTLGGDKFIEFSNDVKNTTKLLRLLLAPTRFQQAANHLIPSISRFRNIVRLDLSCTGIDIEFFSANPAGDILASSLTHLLLSGCPLVNSGSLHHLKTLKTLVFLDISHCDQMDDFGLEVLGFYVPWIKELNLAYLFKLTATGIEKLFRLSGLRTLNLMGCCRIKSYPWAITNKHPKNILSLRELSVGEDSRIQTRGFWLLWCTWQYWDMRKLASICPFLETIKLNMVLFDFPADGLQVLLDECKNLKTLSLVVERNIITSLCAVAEQLRKLRTLDLTIHLGVQGEQMESLIRHNALTRLKGLKFHSKHSNVFTDSSLLALVSKAPLLEYLELNGDDLSSHALVEVVDKLSTTLQSLLLHHVKISNKAMRAIAKRCKVLRDLTITDLQTDCGPSLDMGRVRRDGTERTSGQFSQRDRAMKGLGTANKLRWLVSDPNIGLRLKKIELASYDGFSDKDLSEIPKSCPNLQWVDFHFSFTFPRTLLALGKHCPNLLYLRLFRCSTPLSFDLPETTEPPPLIPLTTPVLTPRTNQQRRRPARPVNITVNTNTAMSQTSSSSSTFSKQGKKKQRPSSTSSPFMATLYADTNTTMLHKATSRRRRRNNNKNSQPSTPTATFVKNSDTKSPEAEITPTMPESIMKKASPQLKKSVGVYPCSSAECRALMEFALPRNKPKKTDSETTSRTGEVKSGRKLRVLDLTGNHGLSDYILSTHFAQGLTNLHTIFLEGADESVTERGVLKFAETLWRSLKRLHIRNCRGVKLNIVQDNFVTKGLEIDLVVNGERFRELE